MYPWGNPKISVALDALRSDAARWSAAAEEMRTAAERASRFILTEQDFSVLLGSELASSYSTIRSKLEHLLTGAHTEFERIGSTLLQVAATYEREDAEGAHELKRAGGDRHGA
ncbi:hypothetical protein M8C13_30070 [Crossiella sp. SN42]|uniref:hypothetical protein n=1 Tax=Crossiella sp. SN42 TaxID=2944808 RepID=UPI00207CC304|nr:hypothetical protein [Crossiella sp. SN42]MCO1580008.1 hypothetical protein [Crossiella sp. SN42]